MNVQPDAEITMSKVAEIALESLGLSPVEKPRSMEASLAALQRIKELGDPQGHVKRLKEAIRSGEVAQIPEIMKGVHALLADKASA